VLLGLLASGPPASAAPFANGSFESPTANNVRRDAPFDFGDWVVTAGNVDQARLPWQPADGEQSIDLNGLTTGTLCQTFDTPIAGAAVVGFMMSHNPDAGNASGALRVRVNGVQQGANFVHNTANSRANMRWQSRSVAITVTTPTTELCFQSAQGSAQGPFIDAVTFAASPGQVTARVTPSRYDAGGREVALAEAARPDPASPAQSEVGGTIAATPLRGSPLRGSPLRGSPLRGSPLRGSPLRGSPLRGSPLRGSPLTEIPLRGSGGWTAVLASTPLRGSPLQTITLGDVLDLDPMPDVTLGDLDPTRGMLRRTSVASLLLLGRPLDALPRSISSCSART
jgi:hypothetical protein